MKENEYQLKEKCKECLLPQKLCNDLQNIVYEKDVEKRREMAQKFRKEYKELNI